MRSFQRKDHVILSKIMISLKDHVNLGFSIEGMSEKEQELFEGGGKTMKHIKVYSLKEVDEKRIIELLKIVKGK